MSYFYLDFEKSLKPLDDIIQSLESEVIIFLTRKHILSLQRNWKKERDGKYLFQFDSVAACSTCSSS